MTSKPNLGPILAMAGGIVAVVAVIAGFIVIGGPGDARDRRLDEMTKGRVMDALNIAQCAFDETGVAPATIEEARMVRRKSVNEGEAATCALGTTAENAPISAGRKPAAPGDVSYEATTSNRIKICANFRRPSDSESCNGICYRAPRETTYPQLAAPHPAGVHCYDIELVKSAESAANGASHAGHMDVFD